MKEKIKKVLALYDLTDQEGSVDAYGLEKLILFATGHCTILSFLKSDPGAIKALVDYMGETNNEEWEDNLDCVLPREEPDDRNDPFRGGFIEDDFADGIDYD